MIPPRLSGIAAVGVTALLLTSCATNEEPVVGIDSLTVATLGSITPGQQAFLDRLEELSGGSIVVDMQENWEPAGGDASPEDALTLALASGEVDMAWITTRSLTALGVTGIDALETPLLIQTHDQQREVATGLAGEIVLRQLRDTGIEGLAMIPGPQQYPVAADAPLLLPADWAGKTVEFASRTSADSVAALTIETLGGSPTADGDDPIADILAGSVQAGSAGPAELLPGGATATGPFLTGNLPLFPKMEIIAINSAVEGRLSTRQHGFIYGATERAQSLAMAAPDLATPLAEACAAGIRFGFTTGDGYTAVRTAVEPIYTALAEDSQEAPLLEAIQAAVVRNAGSGSLPVASECVWVAPPPA